MGGWRLLIPPSLHHHVLLSQPIEADCLDDEERSYAQHFHFLFHHETEKSQ